MFCLVEMGPKMVVLGEKGLNFKFLFCNPKKAHPYVEPRLLTYFRSNPCRHFGGG